MGKSHIGIVGSGAWGTALAQAFAGSKGRSVTLWAREADVVSQVNGHHENKSFLAGVRLSDSIVATSAFGDLASADLVLLVCPAQHLRAMVRALRDANIAMPVLICAKGIERGTGKLMTEVAREEGPGMRFGMLSGPSFATEVARGLPCAVTVAFDDATAAEDIARRLGSPTFRPYASTDVTGVAIGGAVKNVLAIACGVVEGRGFGESARAALTTRGFAEMTRFGVALGARLETMAGLSGLGDLLLTASSRQSRNFSLGVKLAQGGRADDDGPLAEGAATAEALVARARQLKVDMPIADAVAEIVAGRVAVDAAIGALLSRPLKSEH